jgi:hypothetical protein
MQKNSNAYFGLNHKVRWSFDFPLPIELIFINDDRANSAKVFQSHKTVL